VNEFKQMVKALHAGGHRSDPRRRVQPHVRRQRAGADAQLQGAGEPRLLHARQRRQHYKNYSGCGNTVNGNHPIVREMIFHCLRHWVHNYHVDGFRFDLASILSRDRNGNLVPNPPLVEAIAEDPDAGRHQDHRRGVGRGGRLPGRLVRRLRWAEWNGRYRDDVRRFWRGDGGHARRLRHAAGRFERPVRARRAPPYCSINFITSHDGFTLNDLVSYKRQAQRGQRRRQPRRRQQQLQRQLRRGRADRSAAAIESVSGSADQEHAATLMLSQGVPMIVAGDECRRTQRGNNNAYCQDNEISWFDWTLVEQERRPGAVRQGADRVPPVRTTRLQGVALYGLSGAVGFLARFPVMGYDAGIFSAAAPPWN
jgi:isoamylase